MIISIIIFNLYNIVFDKNINSFEYLDSSINTSVLVYKEESEEYKEYVRTHYFNGEDIDTIASKLDRYLNSSLSGKGHFIAEYSLSVGIDPYLCTAVMLQETGCYYNCSGLTKSCNNVGGNKGSPSCNGGSYRRFDTLDDGIRFAINKLNSYYKKGLTKPEQINPYYASDKTWYQKVNNYIRRLKG